MRMNIRGVACGLSVLLLVACGRSPEANAPAPSSGVTGYAAPPAAEEAPAAAPAPASPPAPQGLGDESAKHESPGELDQEFTTLEAAERALNQAKADLDRLALAEPAPTVGRSAANDSAAEKKDGKGGAAAPKAAAAASAGPSALCENACRAFSSLSRAASAVCRLDGDSGRHCGRAKRVLADSQQRVASCSCAAAD
jgi:hypothetical protein